MKKGLTAFQLKLIAVIAMVINHAAHIVVLLPIEQGIMSPMLLSMDIIGKLTAPIMCFFVVEGYYHTSDLRKYLRRMFLFAVISQVPFYLFEHNLPVSFGMFIRDFAHVNVIFTLFMGLLALTVWKSEKLHIALRIPLVVLIVYLTRSSDWRIYGVLWVLAFALFRGTFKKQATAFTAVTAVRVFRNHVMRGPRLLPLAALNMKTIIAQSCSVLALIPLYFYNGEQGRKSKYGFYIFYPAHLLVLAIIKFMILYG